LRFFHIARSNIGRLAVAIWTTNIHSATAATSDPHFARGEPILALAAIEHQLERGDAERKQAEAIDVE
jgi:hypothetical protein